MIGSNRWFCVNDARVVTALQTSVGEGAWAAA
jgi:hypothetical protein